MPKTQRERENAFQVSQCGAGQKPSAVRMSILIERKQRECLCVMLFGDNQKLTLSQWRSCTLPVGVDGEDENSEDPHNCTISDS